MLCQQFLTRMETTKVRSNSKTVPVSMLQSPTILLRGSDSRRVGAERTSRYYPSFDFSTQWRKTVNDETSHSTLTETRNDLAKGLYTSSVLLLKYPFF